MNISSASIYFLHIFFAWEKYVLSIYKETYFTRRFIRRLKDLKKKNDLKRILPHCSLHMDWLTLELSVIIIMLMLKSNSFSIASEKFIGTIIELRTFL